MKLTKRLLVTSFAVLASTCLLIALTQQVHRTLPAPGGNDPYHAATNYFDAKSVWPSALYYLQQKSTTADPHGIQCLALIEPAHTDALGWPFAYLFSADYGCTGAYDTFAPLAFVANSLLFLGATSLIAFGILRLRRRT